MKPSYAAATVPVGQSQVAGPPGGGAGHVGIPRLVVTEGGAPTFSSLAMPVSSDPLGGNGQNGGGGNHGRPRRGSLAKRPRLEENTEGNAKQKKKAVEGTSNSLISGRKMRSPPADIFVWGVHPDTTLEDIVNDLAESDIKIETKDIKKMSKDDASLNSYKIGVPASDLQKALNPEIWPRRVKVREYIYYSKKPKQSDQQQGQGGQAKQQGQGGQAHQHGQGGRAQQHGQGEQAQQQFSSQLQQQLFSQLQQMQVGQQQAGVDGEGVPTFNRFDALRLLGAACL